MEIKNKVLYKQQFGAGDGFTLLELLAVIAILGVVMSFIAINFNALKGPRNVKIATAQLISEMRRIQSYSLSSHNAPGDIPVKYYVLTIPSMTATSYKIQAIDQDFTMLPDIENINLPQGVNFSALKVEMPSGTPVSPDPTCVQVAFSLPFGKVYVDTNRDSDGECNILDYVENPPALVARSNAQVKITISEPRSGSSQVTAIYGVMGKIQHE